MSVNEIQQAANCANWAVSIESENLVWRLYSKKQFQIALYDQNAHSEHCFRGQTGADRAALDWALTRKIEC